MSADFRNSSGYVLDGPEYLTVFDGATGAAIDTVDYSPPRGDVGAWGDAYGYVLVATGRCDIMLDPKLNPWDCAPMIPILREAGGRFTSWAGEESFRVDDGVATNGLLHEPVLQVLGSEVPRAGKVR